MWKELQLSVQIRLFPTICALKWGHALTLWGRAYSHFSYAKARVWVIDSGAVYMWVLMVVSNYNAIPL